VWSGPEEAVNNSASKILRIAPKEIKKHLYNNSYKSMVVEKNELRKMQ